MRNGAAIEFSVDEKPASAEAAVASSLFASSTNRLVRSTNEHAHRGWVASALDEVALPVAGHHPVIRLGRAYMDADHVRDLPGPVLAACAWHSGAAAMAQAGHQLFAQLSARLGIDGRVDRLVGHVAFRFVGERALEGSGHLLR